MSGPLRLRTLGGLALEGVAFARPKPLLLVAYLAVEGPRDRRHLAELFWPHADRPMANLRVALSQLRAGAPGALATDGSRLQALTEPDALVVLRSLEAGDLARATRDYAGAFVDGLRVADLGTELEEWIYATREFLGDAVREAHLKLAEADAAAGDAAAASRRAAAAYRLTGAAEPGPEALERLHALLLAGGSPLAAELAKEALGYGIALGPLPSARPGLLGAGPADATLPPVPHNLHTRGSAFVGRDPELIDLARLLVAAETRIVTLTGPGGVGKSRLALQVAHGALRDAAFPDGVYFVPLEALDDPAVVPNAIAAAVGVELAGADAVEELARGLARRSLLLVLDNFEQVADAATTVAALVERCPGLRLLVTSRTRLNVEAEQRFVVEGLPLPDDRLSLDEAPYQDAVRLFLLRAKKAALDFALTPASLPHVIDICRLVGGLPLGIELAAAWVRLLSPAEIATEVAQGLDFLDGGARDLPGRQQSLRATFEHSWGLLAAGERRTMRRLSVFAGGFTRDAASRVAGATIPLLAALVDASLVRVVERSRFDFHPLLHQYARQKLEDDPAELREARATHAAWIRELVEAAEPALKGAGQAEWIARLDLEHDNVRAALRASVEAGEAVEAMRIAGALWQYWLVRGHTLEARGWYQQVLALPGAAPPSRERAKAASGAGALAFAHGDHAAAEAHHAEALALRRLDDDPWGVAASLYNLGGVRAVLGDLEGARPLFEESIDAFRGLGNTWSVAAGLANLGRLLGLQGDLRAAAEALEESLALRRELGDELGAAEALARLGTLAKRSGDAGRALTLWRQALAARHALGATGLIPDALDALASLLAAHRDAHVAARLWGASERLREAIGAPLAPDARSGHEGEIAVARAADPGGFAAAWSEGRALPLDDAVALALAVATERRD